MVDELQVGPTAKRRHIGRELARLRAEAGLSLRQAAEALDTTESVISRKERGLQSITRMMLRALLDLYGVTDRTYRDSLIQMAKGTTEKGWWREFGPQPYFERYLGLEQAAHTIWRYNGYPVLPSIFLHDDYAKALDRINRPDVDEEQYERWTQLRRARLARVQTTDSPLEMHTVLGEAALHTHAGPPELLAGQLDHLRRLAELPSVTVRILPFTEPRYAAYASRSFVMLGMASDDPDDAVVYLERQGDATYLDDPEEIKRYRSLYDDLAGAAMSAKTSIDLIATLARKVRSQRKKKSHV